MLDLFAGMIAIMVIMAIFAVMIGILVLMIIIRIIGAIVGAVRNSNSASTSYKSSYVNYTPDPPVKKNKYSIDEDYAIPPSSTGSQTFYEWPKETKSASVTTNSSKVYTLVGIRFHEDGKLYDYISDDPNVKVGDVVEIGTSDGVKTHSVQTVTKATEADLALPLSRYKTVSPFNDYVDDIEPDEVEEKSLLEMEEEERMWEPYTCPECFEAYDGIFCENCGHSNDDIGYEEVSEDDKFVEKLTAMAMFDAEERRLEAERAEKDGFMFGGEFGDELDENEW